MSALIDVILPVFLLIGFGYAMARANLMDDTMVDTIMRFSQNFAVPMLLFRGVARLDLGQAFDFGLMFSFYLGAFASFGLCLAGALLIFRRPLTDAIAIGFAGMFSNSLLLGIPITERAYGPESLSGNYAIISIHAMLFYTFGITLMEWARARATGLSLPSLFRTVSRAIFHQPLVIGLFAGFFVSLTGIPVPETIWAATGMMAAAGIPAALFALGGVLRRYKPEGDMATVAMICFGALVVHPGVTWTLGRFVFEIPEAALRSSVVTAAMAPGVNAYLFANLYGVAKRVCASAVLIATAVSILTTWLWLHFLP